MAVFVRKHWNDTAGIVKEGTAVKISQSGNWLSVLNAENIPIARYRVSGVREYWIDGGEKDTLPGDPESSGPLEIRRA